MMFCGLLVVLAALGLAYLLWLKAAKEAGWQKLVGQILAAAIAVVAIIALLHGGMMCKKMGWKMCGMGKDKGAACPMMDSKGDMGHKMMEKAAEKK